MGIILYTCPDIGLYNLASSKSEISILGFWLISTGFEIVFFAIILLFFLTQRFVTSEKSSSFKIFFERSVSAFSPSPTQTKSTSSFLIHISEQKLKTPPAITGISFYFIFSCPSRTFMPNSHISSLKIAIKSGLYSFILLLKSIFQSSVFNWFLFLPLSKEHLNVHLLPSESIP